jgi:hypothetical protein
LGTLRLRAFFGVNLQRFRDFPGHAGSGRLPVRRDQHISGNAGIKSVGRPDIAKQGRVLQHAAIILRTKQYMFDQIGRN